MTISTNSTAAAKSKERVAPPYRLYALLFAAFVAVRLFDLVTRNMEWTFWIYTSQKWQGFLFLLAIVSSAATAIWMKSRVPKLLAWLVCGFVGGAATILTNSSIGMFAGLCVGAPLVFGTAEQGRDLVKWFGQRLLVIFLIPVLTGIVVALTYIHFGQQHGMRELVVAIGLTITGFVAMLWTCGRLALPHWQRWASGLFLFPPVFLLAVFFAFGFDSHLRRNRLDGVGVASYRTSDLVANFFPAAPLASLQIARLLDGRVGEHHATDLTFRQTATERDFQSAQKFPAPVSITVNEGCSITDDHIAGMHLKFLRGFGVFKGANVSPTVFEHIDESKLTSLWLEGKVFGDELLHHLKSTPSLQYLDLNDTGVTSQGLRQIDTTAPLWSLQLSGTDVDDRALETIGKLPALQLLQLNRTRVTGSGLKHLTGMTLRLHLDDTPFDERFLADLPAMGGDGDPWNGLSIGYLSLRGVPITANGVKSLHRLGSLSYLDIGDAPLDDEMIEWLRKMKLQELVVDGAVIAERRNAAFPESQNLTLNWNAAKVELEEIFKQISEIRQFRSVDSVNSGNGNVGRTTLSISKLTLDLESAIKLKRLVDDGGNEFPQIQFHRLVTSEQPASQYARQTNFFHSFQALRESFPDCFSKADIQTN